MKDFSELTERELLALAIALEEEDSRIYEEFAEGLREPYPDTSRMFTEMSAEEDGHRHRLLDLYRGKFGDHLPLIRRQDVRGFIQRKPVWLSRPLGLEKVREQAELMEAESKRFYARAAGRSQDAAIRQLLGDLAAEERRHEAKAEQLEAALITPEVRKSEHEAERRLFLLQVIQPGLAGLMDGSVSTLAPHQRDVLAELAAVELEQAVAVAALLLGHGGEHPRRVGIVLAQPVGELVVDAAVLLLERDGKRQQLGLGQFGEILHVTWRPVILSPDCAGEIPP